MNMSGAPRIPENEDIQDLLNSYERLRTGRGGGFISEESFERIIDHFDDLDAMSKALEAAELATEQFPYSSSLLIKKADLMIAHRRYEEALVLLDKAELLDRNDIDICILRTDAYLALEQPSVAAQLLEEAIQHFEGDERIDLLFELADVYDDYEAFEKIFDCLKLILEYDPNNQEALYKICFWTDFLGRNEDSIVIHMKIIDDFPYNDLAWFNLAAAYQGLKLYEKSIEAYQYAIDINEKFDYAYRNMADAQMRLHRYKDAIESLEKVIELARPEDLIHQAIGYCHEKIKAYAQARFHYRKATHLNPDDARIYIKIAGTYMKESKYLQAVKYLDMGLQIKRLDPEFNLLMGECKVKLGLTKESVHYFQAAVQLKPRNIKGWQALISSLFETRQFAEAARQVQLAMLKTSNKPILRYYESAILLASGKQQDGLRLLNEVVAAHPKLLKVFLKLYPSAVQFPQVVELILRFKKHKRR